MKVRIPEYRADLKSLLEQRNDKVTELEKIVNAAKGETRAMTADEQGKFDALEAEITSIDATIEKEERARKIFNKKPGDQTPDEKRAEAAFDAFLRGDMTALRETRAASGAQDTLINENIIPSEFSNDIIRKVTELSGIYSAVNKVNSTGVYKQIVEDNKIKAGWTAELAEVTKSTGDFKILEISHHKLGSLVKLSYEIINQATFPIVGEVTSQMVDAFTQKIEEAVIKGTGSGQPTGLMSGGTAFDLASATAVTTDEIVKIYHTLKAPYLAKAEWLINRNTLCAVRLLKDKNDRYLFHEAEMTSGYYGYILGKPVLLSEFMPDYQFMFGDFNRAYKANANPQMTIQILNELYSTQGAKGVLGFVYLDGRPVNDEAYVVAKKKEATGG